MLFQVEGTQGQKHNVDTSHIYHGELAGKHKFLAIIE